MEKSNNFHHPFASLC